MAQILAHAAELYLLEQAAVTAVVGPLRAALRALLATYTRLWIGWFGSTTAPADPLRMSTYLTQLRNDLRTITPTGGEELARYARDAIEMGVRQAVDEIHVDPIPDLELELPADVQRAIDDLDDTIVAKLAVADRAAERLDTDTFNDVITEVFAPAQQAVTAAERTTTWVANRAANEGVKAVADQLGVERIWIAERDACVHCLGLSGEVSKDGKFDASKTFHTKPLAVWPGPDLTSAPRHPHCRCRTQVWLGSADGVGPVDFPAALRREAERSILTGWRLPTESERARIEAAERLLQRGTKLPKTVQARARTAVKRGRFNQFPRRTRTTTR